MLIFIVVPKLIKSCILGHDTQKAIKMVMDTEREEIRFKIKNKDEKVPYTDVRVNQNEYSSLVVSYEYPEKNEPYEDYNFLCDISESEVDEQFNFRI